MLENINKFLFMGVGVLLLVGALTSFYQQHTFFQRFEHRYEVELKQENSWLKEATKDKVNPLKLQVSHENPIQNGLLYSGKEFKKQAYILIMPGFNYNIVNNGVVVASENYLTWINSIEDTSQLFITIDSTSNTVYIQKI